VALRLVPEGPSDQLAAGIRAAVGKGDLTAVSAPVDFLGVNYYTPVVVDGHGQSLQRHALSAAGWQQIYPRGLYDILTRIQRDYASPEVVITENGVPDDASDSSLPISDHARSTSLINIYALCTRPLQAAAASRVTTRGLSWTTSNGLPGTPSAGGLSESTSTPSSAPLRHPPPGTRPSRGVTSSNPNDQADGTLHARLI